MRPALAEHHQPYQQRKQEHKSHDSEDERVGRQLAELFFGCNKKVR